MRRQAESLYHDLCTSVAVGTRDLDPDTAKLRRDYGNSSMTWGRAVIVTAEFFVREVGSNPESLEDPDMQETLRLLCELSSSECKDANAIVAKIGHMAQKYYKIASREDAPGVGDAPRDLEGGPRPLLGG